MSYIRDSINCKGTDMAFAEFYRAAYWSYDGRDVRLTEYSERNMHDAVLLALAFDRARAQNLTHLYMRVTIGEFLRND